MAVYLHYMQMCTVHLLTSCFKAVLQILNLQMQLVMCLLHILLNLLQVLELLR